MVLERAADRGSGKRHEFPALGLIAPCSFHQTEASHLKEILVVLASPAEKSSERVGQPQMRHDDLIETALTHLLVGGNRGLVQAPGGQLGERTIGRPCDLPRIGHSALTFKEAVSALLGRLKNSTSMVAAVARWRSLHPRHGRSPERANA
jgi:hypothetical protein